MSRLLQLGHGTISFLARAQEVFKMAWYGNVHFKQQVVSEFLVEEKKSLMKIHKRFKNSIWCH
jgi:hypothetical protein